MNNKDDDKKHKAHAQGAFSIDFLKNIAINLKATGPAAVIISWIMGITLVGVFGQGDIAKSALNALSLVGPMIVIILGQKVS